MFGPVRLAPAVLRRALAPRCAYAVTTSSSVVHSPCGAICTSNVRPVSSIFAGAVAEITVSRPNVSRS